MTYEFHSCLYDTVDDMLAGMVDEFIIEGGNPARDFECFTDTQIATDMTNMWELGGNIDETAHGEQPHMVIHGYDIGGLIMAVTEAREASKWAAIEAADKED